ncbi:MAG: helix-turn-helix domain-containing protein, partial [Saprospiraceae bacterium]|nr:helix-turn-helix domain-containing protein [Saprospiraceae bacterium]
MASNKFKLSQEERSSLKAMLKKGVHRSVELMRARVLLSLDAQKKKSDISKDESIAYATVFNILNRYKTGGLKNA